MARFFLFIFGTWTAMNIYAVARLLATPPLAGRAPRILVIVLGALLWGAYPASRLLDHWGLPAAAAVFEFAGANWLGALFLLVLCLLVADVGTGFGFLLPRIAPAARAAAVAAAAALSLIAVAQGLREPWQHDFDLEIAGLPPARDGMTIVELSDLHLGPLVSQARTARLVERVNALRPDVVVVVGDLIDSAERAEAFLPILRRLSAPLGVWGVTGNHEFYAGLAESERYFREAGIQLLRDRWAEAAPGLVIAGVDDLTARRQRGVDGAAVQHALQGRAPGLTLFLSHTPWRAQEAAAAGANLMLCGHTHNGQIWPFRYFVQPMYPFMAGLYRQDGMPVIVCRGTGMWGPRMRLWRRSEIVRVTLHAPGKGPAPAPDSQRSVRTSK